jgi:hypothetical protein
MQKKQFQREEQKQRNPGGSSIDAGAGVVPSSLKTWGVDTTTTTNATTASKATTVASSSQVGSTAIAGTGASTETIIGTTEKKVVTQTSNLLA